jgi:hypothetical protein
MIGIGSKYVSPILEGIFSVGNIATLPVRTTGEILILPGTRENKPIACVMSPTAIRLLAISSSVTTSFSLIHLVSNSMILDGIGKSAKSTE